MSVLIMAFILLGAMPIIRYSQSFWYLLPNGKKVGPCYWGFYEGADCKDDPARLCIEVKRPTFKEIVAYGSSRYAQGKPVKSARK